MTRKILNIVPVKGQGLLPRMETDAFAQDTEINTVTLERGPSHVEYHYYEALMLVDMLHVIKKAENDGYDAAVISCFYDPGLAEAREITQRLVVAAPCEAAVHIASTLGHKFSIIVGRRKWIPQMNDTVVRYGFKDRLASFKSVDLGVPEFHQDEQETIRRFIEVGTEAVDKDEAEVVILGCTAASGFYRDLQRELGVPVIDASIAALKYAEFLIDVRDRLGWGHSKIGGYESPPLHEIEEWDLAGQYDFGPQLWAPESDPVQRKVLST